MTLKGMKRVAQKDWNKITNTYENRIVVRTKTLKDLINPARFRNYCGRKIFADSIRHYINRNEVY